MCTHGLGISLLFARVSPHLIFGVMPYNHQMGKLNGNFGIQKDFVPLCAHKKTRHELWTILIYLPGK